LRNGRVHLNRRGRRFSRLLAAELCTSAVVMLDKPCSEVVWRFLVTHSIRQFPLHFPSHASPCAITFQLDSTQPDKIGCHKRSMLFSFYSNPTVDLRLYFFKIKFPLICLFSQQVWNGGAAIFPTFVC